MDDEVNVQGIAKVSGRQEFDFVLHSICQPTSRIPAQTVEGASNVRIDREDFATHRVHQDALRTLPSDSRQALQKTLRRRVVEISQEPAEVGNPISVKAL